MSDILSNEILQDMKIFHQVSSQVKNPQPGLSCGIKASWKSYGGNDEQILFYTQTNWINGNLPDAENWLVFRLELLQEILKNANLPQNQYQSAIATCLIEPSHNLASADVLFHAALQSTYTCIAEPLSLLTLFNMKDGMNRLGKLFDKQPVIIPFLFNYTSLDSITEAENNQPPKGIILKNKGVLVFDNKLESCFNQLDEIQKRLEAGISGNLNLLENQASDVSESDVLEILPGLRQSISKKLNHPAILHQDHSLKTIAADNEDLARDLLPGYSPLPVFAARANFINLHDVETSPSSSADDNIQTASLKHCTTLQTKLGAVSAGMTLEEASYTSAAFRTMVQAKLAAQQSGELIPLPQQPIHFPFPLTSQAESSNLPFSGEIGLVTGAASGIGRACAESLLARGAVVVGLDINPAITNVFDHPHFLGLVCDITREDIVKQSLATIVQTFGGLDIMVLNAGLFPKGCHIHSIQLEEFNRVLSINLTSNLILMREAYPLLKCAPRYGRVAIVGSKNAKAPGPGAVAYSTSKAGIIQMARVAAMEWAPDGIRVNVINPDSVFDTALYNEAVLKARADYYNMTVEQYKKRNLLKTEITSHIVGEMVAEMCGELFVATTGAQIQVDGGNDRTI